MRSLAYTHSAYQAIAPGREMATDTPATRRRLRLLVDGEPARWHIDPQPPDPGFNWHTVGVGRADKVSKRRFNNWETL
ncbi:hypothetical protein DS6A_59 [Mycobacterium phage DS6A]|uniref:Uncharacterized protein n=1 Tax=Mycobacterium phage DS6A TaxID=45764 RepID=G8I4G9_9CAUD|nr:hypothetical protein DS6A_59 [Mycobacterium phage DS6A]AER47613.1 hypothetical protein DS6A_59 [Mycobacterium phage DS6A]